MGSACTHGAHTYTCTHNCDPTDQFLFTPPPPGPVSAFLLHQHSFRQAVLDALQRLHTRP